MTVVRTYWGQDVDTDGPVWTLDASLRLDFGFFDKLGETASYYASCLKAYLREEVRTKQATTVVNEFNNVRWIMTKPTVVACLNKSDNSFLHEAYALFKTRFCVQDAKNALSCSRRWYVHCADRCMEGFDPDAASAMMAFTIGKGPTGIAVRRADPDEGPLSEGEARRLERALWKAAEERSLPLRVVVAGLLLTFLGCRPENLARLNVGDLRIAGDRPSLNVPRVKTGLPQKRGAFRSRAIHPRLASLVAELEAEDRSLGPMHEVESELPLFLVRRKGQTYFRRASGAWFANAVSKLPDALGVVHDDGRRMRLWPRRLRYTFARRHALRGVSKALMMDLLDHSDVDSVMVYFEPGMELVDVLDTTIGPLLAPLALEAMSPPLLNPEGTAEQPASAPLRSSAPLAGYSGFPYDCLRCARFVAVPTAALREVPIRIERDVLRCATDADADLIRSTTASLVARAASAT